MQPDTTACDQARTTTELSQGSAAHAASRLPEGTSPQASATPAEMTDARCRFELADVIPLLQSLQAKSVFLVADAQAYRQSGAERILQPLLNGFQVHCFSEFEPNPKWEDVRNGIEQFAKFQGDVVLAIGGGTAIDIAKLIAISRGDEQILMNTILGKGSLKQAGFPLIAVPTTSGTGSEATQFAVVYVEGVKHSVDDPLLLPRFCILDPELTARLPASITAQSGLDAFCQAIESLWSVRSTEASTADALEAARLAFLSLPRAVQSPTKESRSAMCRAAHLAGRAINRTRTTASHALSYALTSDYGIPHGHAVALTLGPLLKFNAAAAGLGDSCLDEDDSSASRKTVRVNDPRGREHVQQVIQKILGVMDCRTPDEGCQRIQSLMNEVGCQTRLSPLGIHGQEVLEGLAGRVNVDRLNNNPFPLSHDDLVGILRSIA